MPSLCTYFTSSFAIDAHSFCAPCRVHTSLSVTTMSSNFVDLTVARHQPDGYSDEEDEAAFGYEWKYRRLYREIWRIKQNDPNFGRLCLDCSDISEAMCERVGTYLWTSQHIKSLELQGLTGNNLRNLFGKIASQNETNDFIIKKDVLSNIVDNEKKPGHFS